MAVRKWRGATRKIVPHPTAIQSPEAVRQLEKATDCKAVLVDGRPVLVRAADAGKYLSTGG